MSDRQRQNVLYIHCWHIRVVTSTFYRRPIENVHFLIKITYIAYIRADQKPACDFLFVILISCLALFPRYCRSLVKFSLSRGGTSLWHTCWGEPLNSRLQSVTWRNRKQHPPLL